MERRQDLMTQFERREITRVFYLKEIGAISLKADRAAARARVPNDEDGDLPAPVSDSESNDSLSETRPAPDTSDDSDVDQEDPFLSADSRRTKTRPQLPKKKPSAVNKQLCPVCKRGFQLRRDPPLHLACLGCGNFTHKRCIKNMEVEFFCLKCKPIPPACPREPPAGPTRLPPDSTSPGRSTSQPGPAASTTRGPREPPAGSTRSPPGSASPGRSTSPPGPAASTTRGT